MTFILIIVVILLLGSSIFLFLSPNDDDKAEFKSKSHLAKPAFDSESTMEPVVASPHTPGAFEGSFHKPGPNKRVCGYLIDVLVFSVFGLIVRLIFNLDFHWSIFFIYLILRDSLGGRSIGKRIVGLQIINKKNDVIVPFEGIIRNITMGIPFVAVVEYFVMVRNNDGKRLGDMIAGTKVNDLRSERGDRVFLWFSILVLVLNILFFGMWGGLNPQQSNIRESGEYLGAVKEVEISEDSPYAAIDNVVCNNALDNLMSEEYEIMMGEIRKILNNSERYCPPALYLLSHRLFHLGEKDSALFWFYAGQLRGRFDANRCADMAARSAIDVLNEEFGSINQYALQDLDKLKGIVADVIGWDKMTPHLYDHRWINLHSPKLIAWELRPDKENFNGSFFIMSLPESEWDEIQRKTQEEYWDGFNQSISILENQ